MSTVAGIGDGDTLEGFALAGVHVLVTAGDDDIISAWKGLDTSVGMVILSRRAAEVLAGELDVQSERLTVVMP